MTVRSELVAALPANAGALSIQAILAAGTSPFKLLTDGNVYWDTRTRAKRAEKEVLLIWGGREPVSTVTGRRIKNKLAIEFFLATYDAVHAKANRYEEAIEVAARELVEAFDQQETLFEGVLTARVNSVRCVESSSVDMLLPDASDERVRYIQTLMLEVTTWET